MAVSPTYYAVAQRTYQENKYTVDYTDEDLELFFRSLDYTNVSSISVELVGTKNLRYDVIVKRSTND